MGQKSSQTHIKEFKEQKNPRYAIEMAAVVAYYLQDLAPPKERKDTISTRDVETYFKIAEFKLPTKPQFTLPNAKAAGYFDAVGNGEYKLNAVGHNLVAHSLPRGKDDNIARARKPKGKSAPWPAPGSGDTKFGVTMGPEGGHAETEVYAGVQA
jgi:hypothetical protein